MPQVKDKLQVNSFVGGLVTDFNPLETPTNTTVDEDNVNLDRTGFRRRRLGLETTGGDVVGEYTGTDTKYIKSYPWDSVNNNGNVNFLVVQIGGILSFFNKAFKTTAGLLPFTVNLSTFAAPGVTDVTTDGIQVASGRGLLFVVGRLIEPFFIEYDNDTNTISTTAITIQIRDFKEQDVSLANDARPATISDARRYDLYNQGWITIPPYLYNQYPNLVGAVNNSTINALDFYKLARNVYPPKTKPWFVGKRLGDGDHEYFVPDDTYDMIEGGNTLAALGRFIVDAFDIDRAAVSGISSLPKEVLEDRPTAVAFFAGRVFYALGNIIYYSQILEDDTTVVGKCFQEADPTAEDISDLIATDGGTLMIPASGDAISLFPIENSLLFFSNNGIWAIGGDTPGSGFSATSFSVQKISSIGAISSRTIINVTGLPAWWGLQGIYTLAPQESKSGIYQIDCITDGKIFNFYTDLSVLAKRFATGAYDNIQKRMIWLFSSELDLDTITDRFNYDRVLNYDLLRQSWFPYTIADRTANGNYLWDIFNIQTTNSTTVEYDVVKNDGTTFVTNAALDQVVTQNVTYSTATGLTSDVLYLVSWVPPEEPE